MMNVQLVDELREVADWFRLRGLDENAALLDHAAHVVQCAADFFAWYNKYHPEPSSHPHHPWCVLGVLLTHDKNDSARAALARAAQPADVDADRADQEVERNLKEALRQNDASVLPGLVAVALAACDAVDDLIEKWYATRESGCLPNQVVRARGASNLLRAIATSCSARTATSGSS